MDPPGGPQALDIGRKAPFKIQHLPTTCLARCFVTRMFTYVLRFHTFCDVTVKNGPTWRATSSRYRDRPTCVPYTYGIDPICVPYTYGIDPICVRYTYGIDPICVRYTCGTVPISRACGPPGGSIFDRYIAKRVKPQDICEHACDKTSGKTCCWQMLYLEGCFTPDIESLWPARWVHF